MSDTMTVRRDQGGQMLVSVIVLLTLMFFIGSAMALAVSTSLHTIAQTNNVDSGAYAAESAVAQGFARIATPLYSAPQFVAGSGRALVAAGCNNGIAGGGGGGGGETGDRGGNGSDRGSGGNGSNGASGGRSKAGNVVSAATGITTLSYRYEVVADDGGGRDLVGRSDMGTDNQGPSVLNATSHETIFIPYITRIPNLSSGASISFEVYRTVAGGDPDTTGCIGVFAQQPGGTTIFDTGPVSPAPPMCTSPRAPALFSQVNKFTLTASTCRVPVATRPDALQIWSAPGQTVGACAQQSLTPAFSPGSTPGTVWGVLGWQSATPRATLRVSVSACGGPRCSTRTAAPGVLYYWCLLPQPIPPAPPVVVDSLYLSVGAGPATATVKAFVVRAAPSGTDCVATTMGHAGRVANEAARRMPACGWTGSTQNMWNRVLP